MKEGEDTVGSTFYGGAFVILGMARASRSTNASSLKELNHIMLVIKGACDSNVPENRKTRLLGN